MVISGTVRWGTPNPRRVLKAGFLELGTACSPVYGSTAYWTSQDLKSGSWSSACSLITHWEVTSPLWASVSASVSCPAHLKGFGDNPKRKM